MNAFDVDFVNARTHATRVNAEITSCCLRHVVLCALRPPSCYEEGELAFQGGSGGREEVVK